MRFHAPYMEWAKKRPAAMFDLAGSNVLSCSLADLEGARDALLLSGSNDNGYQPLLDAIARRYLVQPAQVTTANGAAGANFQAMAAVLEPGDDVLMERPGYDPLPGAARLLGANIVRFDRRFEDDFAIDPDAIARALTPRTRLIIISSPHNPTGAVADLAALEAIGRIASTAGAYVLVDEVYLDAAEPARQPAALIGEPSTSPFISTSSLTKSYGLSSLRCGWTISSPPSPNASGARATSSMGPDPSRPNGWQRWPLRNSIASRREPLRCSLSTARSCTRSCAVVRRSTSSCRGTAPSSSRASERFGDTSAFAERLLAEHGTAIVPGKFFEAPAHFRLGFGGPSEVVRAGLEQLRVAWMACTVSHEL